MKEKPEVRDAQKIPSIFFGAMFFQWILLPAFCSLLASSSPKFPHPNLVTNLPDAPIHPEFPMYSGFLNATSDGNSSLFYILVEAIRVDPSTAPLLVWFNGGPGGSSLAGFFLEHGPFRVTGTDGVLTYNEFTWNQYANVLYLESPLGVGFSQTNEENYTEDDETAADNSFYALQDFMTRVHPNYAQRDYYLSGQSYVGAYIPWLSRRLLRGLSNGEMNNLNFKGFAIGNPTFTDSALVIGDSLAYLVNGVIPQNYTDMLFDAWKKVLKGEGLDRTFEDIELTPLLEKVMKYFNGSMIYNIVDHCPLPTVDAEKVKKYHRQENGQSFSCYGAKALEKYLNRNDVQTSLHVKNQFKHETMWINVNEKLYVRYNRTANTLPIYNDIISLLNRKSFRMLIYHGDTDAMLPVVSTVQSTTKIAVDNNMTDQGFTPAWHFFGDYAGSRTGYRSISGKISLDVLTVRGAGHSVPTALPDHAFQMINNFLFTKEDEAIDYSNPILKH